MAYWANTDPLWLSLSPTQKAAAMALMEADARNPGDAQNVLGAIINRAQKSGTDLGEQVSGKIYQPTTENSQQQRLRSIVQDPNFQALDQLAQSRVRGETGDWVNGATHFLAPEKTMLALEAREPDKYKSWREWTKYDPDTGQYPDVILRDHSHAFLAPEGEYQGPRASGAPDGADKAPTPIVATAADPETSQKANPMFDLFKMLGSSGADMSGLGSGVPSLPSAADGADTLGDINPMGKLGLLAKSMGGGGMSDKEAAGQPLQPAQFNYKPPAFDMAKLQAMLQQMSQLGASLPRKA